MPDRSRILIGALSGHALEDRRTLCRRSWFPRAAATPGIDAVFLLGAGDRGPEREGDSLYLPCPDDYQSLPQRTRWFCQWALGAGGDWDYLFKCDDDTFVAVARLAAYDLASRDYVGAEWQAGVGYGSGGAGYFLSRRAAAIVAAELTCQVGPEDLLVGRTLAAHGISLSIEPRLIAFGSTLRRPRADNDLITLHACTVAFEMCAAEGVG